MYSLDFIRYEGIIEIPSFYFKGLGVKGTYKGPKFESGAKRSEKRPRSGVEARNVLGRDDYLFVATQTPRGM